MMTLHAAKGLEFDTVFLPGWEEGLFPSQRTLDEGGLKGLEEERRLAYVGLTRARKRAVVSYAANRRIYANWQSSIPSRFVDELPEAHVDTRRVGGDAAGGAAAVGAQRVHQRPVDGPAPHGAARRRGVGTARPAAAAGRDRRGAARVFHQKFGYGDVLAVDDDRLDIVFEKAGQKRLLDRFVEKV